MITIKTLMFTSFGKKSSVGSKCLLSMPLNMSTFRISQTFKKKKRRMRMCLKSLFNILLREIPLADQVLWNNPLHYVNIYPVISLIKKLTGQ